MQIHHLGYRIRGFYRVAALGLESWYAACMTQSRKPFLTVVNGGK
jgi:hypothetical protein